MGKNMTIPLHDLEVWKRILREFLRESSHFQNTEQIRKNDTPIFSPITANSIMLLVFFHHHIPLTEDMYEIRVLEKYIFYDSVVFILSLVEEKKKKRCKGFLQPLMLCFYGRSFFNVNHDTTSKHGQNHRSCLYATSFLQTWFHWTMLKCYESSVCMEFHRISSHVLFQE